MIGLKRGTVKLLPYNKKWKNLFEKERAQFENKFGNRIVDIQHIGSTAIPGIFAKPIIDISIGVQSMKDVKTLIKPLKNMGYELRKKSSGLNTQILFVKGPQSKRTHYLHVMKYNGSLWKNDLLFRDYLRTHRNRAKQYVNLKKELAEKHADDRTIYTKSKTNFIITTIKMARRSLK